MKSFTLQLNVELLSSLDLLPAGEVGGSRQVLFDLSPLAALDAPPCALGSARLWLSPIGENVTLVLDEEASDAKLQVVWF